MKHKLNIALLLMFALASVFQSCNDDETYADKRKRENKQIAGFIQTGAQVKSADDEDEYLLNIPGNIKVISESDFYKMIARPMYRRMNMCTLTARVYTCR